MVFFRIIYYYKKPVLATSCQFCLFLLRSWSEATLSGAYAALLDDVTLGASAPGGEVVFRRSLTLSMFFRFYLHVLQHLRDQVRLHKLMTNEVRVNYKN